MQACSRIPQAISIYVSVNSELSVCFLNCRESRYLQSMDRSQPAGRGLGDKQRLRIEQGLHPVKTEVSAADLPIIGDLHQHLAYQADDRVLVVEDPHHIGPPLDLLV